MHGVDGRLRISDAFAAILLCALLALAGCSHSGGFVRGTDSAAGAETQDARCAPDAGGTMTAASLDECWPAPPSERDAALARLVAIEEIEQLKARFMRCVDTKDLVCLRDEVFAPGAEIHFIGSDYEFAAVGWTAIEKLYQEAFSAKKFGMHHAHTPEITVDGATARGTWYLHDVFVNLEEGWTLSGSALYDDSYAKIDGQWRIMYSSYRRLWEETTPRDPRTRLGSKPIGD